MKNFIAIIFALSLTAPALAVTSTCTSESDYTKGQITLKIEGGIAQLTGEYASANKGFGVMIYPACTGSGGNFRNGFYYYAMTKDWNCPISYLRVPAAFLRTGKGRVTLVDRSGGDMHDWSGYAYDSFNCR